MRHNHEGMVDRVRSFLREGKGMTEIMNITKLSSEEFLEIRNKLQSKYDKEYNDRLR